MKRQNAIRQCWERRRDHVSQRTAQYRRTGHVAHCRKSVFQAVHRELAEPQPVPIVAHVETGYVVKGAYAPLLAKVQLMATAEPPAPLARWEGPIVVDHQHQRHTTVAIAELRARFDRFQLVHDAVGHVGVLERS